MSECVRFLEIDSAETNTGDVVRLRPAVMEDSPILFRWRNLPEIIAHGSQRRSVTREEHERWFAESLMGEKRLVFIILLSGQPEGQLRLDRSGSDEIEISLYLMAGFTGRGFGVQAIRHGCAVARRMSGVLRVVAWVREENARSVAAFRRAGFKPSDSGSRAGHFRLTLEFPPVVPHNRLTFGVEEEQAVLRAVRSGRWANGNELATLEARIAREAGVRHAIGVGSGVAALRLSLLALGIGPNDEVAVPAYSCVALANAVLACGARPVPIDVEAETWNISPDALRATLAAHPKIKAAIAVHTFGCPAAVREIEELGVPVLEDCSHAFGRAPLGRLGRIGMLSLHATKLIGAGEGGVVFTSDSALAEQIRCARDYADQPPAAWRLNDKMTDIEAALAVCQLDRLPNTLARRDELARRYASLLVGPGLPAQRPGRVWYRYAVSVPDADALIAAMALQGVHAARPVENWCGKETAAFATSASAFRRIVSLPLYPTLTDAEQDRVVAAFSVATSSHKAA